MTETLQSRKNVLKRIDSERKPSRQARVLYLRTALESTTKIKEAKERILLEAKIVNSVLKTFAFQSKILL